MSGTPVFITRDEGGSVNLIVRHVSMPWEELDNINGVHGETVIMDVSYLLEEIDRFRDAVMEIRDVTNAFKGEPLQ